MKVDQVRDSVNCRVDEVRYFVKIVDVVRVDQVNVDQVGCSHIIQDLDINSIVSDSYIKSEVYFYHTNQFDIASDESCCNNSMLEAREQIKVSSAF